jgi:hypothetical protein
MGLLFRRSLTCGYENPAFQAVFVGDIPVRRSLTCGYENLALRAVCLFF